MTMTMASTVVPTVIPIDHTSVDIDLTNHYNDDDDDDDDVLIVSSRRRRRIQQRQSDGDDDDDDDDDSNDNVPMRVLHPPCTITKTAAAATTTSANASATRGHDNNDSRNGFNYLVNFSTTVSEDVDDFVLQSTGGGSIRTYCGIWDCWEETLMSGNHCHKYNHNSNGNRNNNNNRNHSRYRCTVPSDTIPYSAPPCAVLVETNDDRNNIPGARTTTTTTAKDERGHCWPDAKMIPPAACHNNRNHSSGVPNHYATENHPDVDVVMMEGEGGEEPREMDRPKRTVSFDATKDRVVEYQPPMAHETPDLFWNDTDIYECRAERRALLLRFQQHVSYTPHRPWTEEAESM